MRRLKLLLSRLDINKSAKRGPRGLPIATPSVWRNNCPLNWNWMFLVRRFRSFLNSLVGIGILPASRQINSMISSTGTFVKRDTTSNETRCLPVLLKSVRLICSTIDTFVP
ncbi:unnamed protein product [Heterobilharzia americana]|nr:unnamed protein product [Heterobilharzia americana]